MGETAELMEWIDRQHLTSDAFQSYAEIFSRHPARVIVVREFLLESVARSLSRFFSAEAVFRSEFGMYSRMDDVSVTEEEWLKANEDDRFYRYKVFGGVRPEFHISLNTITFLK